jgi:hypothetical protein
MITVSSTENSSNANWSWRSLLRHEGLKHRLAFGGLELTAEDFHQRGLATAVRTDQTLAVAVVELDGTVFKKGFGPKLNCEVGGGDHGN